MSSKVVRVGLVGYGGMGSTHVGQITRGMIPGLEMAAVSDTSAERLTSAREKLGDGVEYYSDPAAMMASGKVDAVLIATPHYDHPPLAIAALRAGLHALVEKPAGVYTKQVRELNEEARKHDRVFAIMFNQRTRGYHQKMKRLVSDGTLGQLRRTEYVVTNWLRSQVYYDSGGWRGTWAGEGGGVLMNQCPHNLDLFQWIVGLPKRVRAFCKFGHFHNIEVEDSVTAYMEYENGATGVFITTTGEAPGVNRLEVVGDHGRLVLENEKIVMYRTPEAVSKVINETTDSFPTPEVWEIQIPGGPRGEEHMGILKNFAGAILRGEPLLARGEEGINGLTLGNAMLLSSWTDNWVDLPLDEDLYERKLKERIAESTFKKPEVRKPTSHVLGGSFAGV